MKVRELIRKLKGFKPELDVEFETASGDTIGEFTLDEAYNVCIIKELEK